MNRGTRRGYGDRLRSQSEEAGVVIEEKRTADGPLKGLRRHERGTEGQPTPQGVRERKGKGRHNG